MKQIEFILCNISHTYECIAKIGDHMCHVNMNMNVQGLFHIIDINVIKQKTKQHLHHASGARLILQINH